MAEKTCRWQKIPVGKHLIFHGICVKLLKGIHLPLFGTTLLGVCYERNFGMKKDYQKPVAELITLSAAEDIAIVNLDVDPNKIRLGDVIGGEMGNDSSIFDF